MRSSVNLALQLAAVMISAALRLTSPGWLLIIFFVVVPIGSAAAIAQLVTAACAVRWRRIAPVAATCSVATAVCMVGASLLVTDGGDGDSSIHRPVDVLLGTRLDWADGIGWLMVLGWLAGVVASGIAVIVTRPRPVRPPYVPAPYVPAPYAQQLPYAPQPPYGHQPCAPAPQDVWAAPHR